MQNKSSKEKMIYLTNQLASVDSCDFGDCFPKDSKQNFWLVCPEGSATWIVDKQIEDCHCLF